MNVVVTLESIVEDFSTWININVKKLKFLTQKNELEFFFLTLIKDKEKNFQEKLQERLMTLIRKYDEDFPLDNLL